jgi:hypothetical protein
VATSSLNGALGYPDWISDSQSIRAVAMNTGSQWPVTFLLKKGLTISNEGIGYVVLPK